MPRISCTTGSIGYGAVSQGGHTQIITLNGSFYGLNEGFTNYAYWTFGVTHTDTAPYNIITGLNGYPFSDEDSGGYSYIIDGTLHGNYSQTPALAALACDTTYVRRSKMTDDGGGSAQGYSISFKTYAVTAVAGTPGSSSVTSTTATINCDYYPNTVESTASVWLEYKKSTDSTWAIAGATATGQTGYSILNLSRNLTGLTGSTQYQFRLQMTRTTANDTTLSSATSTFTTAAAAPTITIAAASGLTNTTATLNATVDTNGISTDISFEWDVDTGAPYANATTPAETYAVDGNHTISKGITGLTYSTTYYFRAKAVYSGGTLYSAETSFTTTANPNAVAAKEARMQVYEYRRKYGVLLVNNSGAQAPLANASLFFTLQTPSGTNSDTFIAGATIAAADSLISKDGGAFTTTTNVPVALGNGYRLILTAAEMTANEIDVIIKDASTGAEIFRDCHLRIITHVQLGSVDIDVASGTKADTTAFKVTGYGTGHGLSAVAGATGQDINGVLGEHCLHSGLVAAGSAGTTLRLASTAVATADNYNGSIVLITSGTGIGQARVIVDYATANKEATVNKTWVATPAENDGYIIIPGNDLWEVSPLVELAALPTSASSFGKIVQFLFQRFAFKRTQDATQHLMFNASSTAGGIFKAGVSDNGTIQSFNKVEIV